MLAASHTSQLEAQEFFPFKFIVRSPFEPFSQHHKMDVHDSKNNLIKTTPNCAHIFSEKDIDTPCNDCTNKARHEDADRKNVIEETGNIMKNSERSDNPDDHQGHNYLGSSSTGHIHPGSSYVGNAITNERNSRSGRVQQDDEFLNTRLSTVTIRKAEIDEELYDICSMPSLFAAEDISPPLQTNEAYKEIHNLMPGMFLLKKWLTEPEQVAIVKKCLELGVGNGGFFQPSFGGGEKMHLRMMCLGMNWNHETYKYEEIREHDNAQPPPIPSDFFPLVQRAIEDSHNKLVMDYNIRPREELSKFLPSLHPDVCIVNFYEDSGRLGLHQDKDESLESLEKGLPVVSFSIGDTAEFCYGNDRKIENHNKINLESGDVLIFGGESRLVFHSISKIFPGTAPHWLTERTSLCRPGRLNLTFRQISI